MAAAIAEDACVAPGAVAVAATARRHHLAILGGGFGGLYAAKALRRSDVEVTLVDRRNFHLFQPLLYQVATGSLSPGDIASPLRYVLRHAANTRVLLAEATDIDVDRRRLITSEGEVAYDTLIVATGARHHYFGHDDWEKSAPSLKTIEDATEIRRRLFLAFEAAELETDPLRRHAWLTFVLVGAGPTGVELAGALSEIARETLRNDFRSINPAEARIFLLEGTERVLPAFPPDLSAKAEASLVTLGVAVRTRTMVTEVDEEGVSARCGDQVERIQARTVLWAAGVQASPLGKVLAARAGAPLDRAGRVIVGPDLTVPNHPEIFVIGDLAHYAHQDGQPLPGVAQVAMQQGRYVAAAVRARAAGELPATPFRYFDKGSMATIGRRKAVAQLHRLHFGGTLAWLLWVFIHVLYLIEFENRLVVLVHWAWSYLTWNRGARLITGDRLLPPPDDRPR